MFFPDRRCRTVPVTPNCCSPKAAAICKMAIMAMPKYASSRRSLAPDSAEIWANIAFLKERSGLLAEAEACYRHALLRLPDN